MRQLRYYSLLLWLLLRSIPPVSPGRLLMPAVFLSCWTVLSASGLGENLAFVASAVLAQLAQVWAGLPGAARREWLRHGSGSATRSVGRIVFLVLAVQVWWAEPLITQRALTGICAVYVAVMCWGAFGDRGVLDAFARLGPGSGVSLVARKHLLRLYALTGFLVIAVNESLIAMAAPLGARVVALSLLPLVLHVFYEIALRLTWPFGDEEGADN